MGHHRFKTQVDAVIEAPASVPTNQDPSTQTLEQIIGAKLTETDVGGTYKIKTANLKVKKTQSDT